MIPISTEAPPCVELDEDDPYIKYMLMQAPPDIKGAAFRYMLRVLLDGKGHLIGTFDALDLLLTAYAEVGKTSFTAREIAVAAPGVSRGHIPDNLRALAEKHAIRITGRAGNDRLKRQHKGKSEDLRPGTYYIDHEYLNRLAAKTYAELMRELSLPMSRPKARPSPNQQALPLALPSLAERSTPTSPDDSPRRNGGSLSPRDVSFVPLHTILTPMGVSDRHSNAHEAGTLTPVGASGICTQNGALTPMGVSAPFTDLLEASSLAPTDVSYSPLTPTGVSLNHQVSELSHQGVSHDPNEGRSLTPQGVMIDHERDQEERDQEGEEGSRAARGHTHTSFDLRAIVREEIRAAIGGAQFSSPPGTDQLSHSEIIPAAPPGEEPVTAGPLQVWTEVTGSYPSPRFARQLRELICQYDKKTQKHGEYWLTRVIATASLSIKKPEEMVPAYLVPILRRLELASFDTSVLIQERQERGGDDVSRRPPAPSRTHDPAVVELPPALRAAPSVAVWLEEAPEDVAITVDQAEFIRAKVQNLDLWRAVLRNWKVGKRNVSASYSNVSGQVDRYQKESRGLQAHQEEQRAAPPPGRLAEAHQSADQTKQSAVMTRAKEIAAGEYPGASESVRRKVTAWLIGELMLDRPEADILSAMHEKFPRSAIEQGGGV